MHICESQQLHADYHHDCDIVHDITEQLHKADRIGPLSYNSATDDLLSFSALLTSKVPSSLVSSAQLRQQPDLSATLVLPSGD